MAITLRALAMCGLVGVLTAQWFYLEGQVPEDPRAAIELFLANPSWNPGVVVSPCPDTSPVQNARFEAFAAYPFESRQEDNIALGWMPGLRRCNDPRILAWYQGRLIARAQPGMERTSLWHGLEAADTAQIDGFLTSFMLNDDLDPQARDEAANVYVSGRLPYDVQRRRYLALLAIHRPPSGRISTFLRNGDRDFLQGLDLLARTDPAAVAIVMDFVLSALRQGVLPADDAHLQALIVEMKAFAEANPTALSRSVQFELGRLR